MSTKREKCIASVRIELLIDAASFGTPEEAANAHAQTALQKQMHNI